MIGASSTGKGSSSSAEVRGRWVICGCCGCWIVICWLFDKSERIWRDVFNTSSKVEDCIDSSLIVEVEGGEEVVVVEVVAWIWICDVSEHGRFCDKHLKHWEEDFEEEGKHLVFLNLQESQALDTLFGLRDIDYWLFGR